METKYHKLSSPASSLVQEIEGLGFAVLEKCEGVYIIMQKGREVGQLREGIQNPRSVLESRCDELDLYAENRPEEK
ncbi:hypothetical protein HYT57_02740 [Candidatus Woesearchaeota archaeon]|nr:hypothetical protein [Candidatus Woesearchaeota archaeon]